MAENARAPLQHERQSGIMQDRTTNLANTPASGRCGLAGIPVALSGNEEHGGGLPFGVPNTSAPSAVTGPPAIELGDLFPRKTRQDVAYAEMPHDPRFPSPVKTPPQAKSSPTRSRELLLESSVDDIAAVLARGFEISPSSSGTARPNQDHHSQPSPPPPSGEDSRVRMRTQVDNISSSSGLCMNTDNNSGVPMVTIANKRDVNSTPSVTSKDDNSPPPPPPPQQQQHQRVRGQDSAAASAAGAAASGGRRSTRAQKKNAKKWLSKRQGRMPDGGLTIPGGALS